MSRALSLFEGIVRKSQHVGRNGVGSDRTAHPFDEWNIHSKISEICLKLFDDGHYSQAVFEAFKYVDNEVKHLSGIKDSGYKLMMAAFAESSPKIQLTELKTSSDVDEQMGFKFVFAGVMSAIRNPRGHEIVSDTIDRCLDYLSVASVLLRRIEERRAP